jgi:ATP-dependent exoDNAse (exonuclease V) beta subunit
MIDKIINASAGTGKTHTILNAALEGAKNEKEIRDRLASTVFLSFSTSAVEEIKSRLFEMTNTDKTKKSGLFDELVSFPEYRAYTIHGFAVELAKLLRYELGMPANVEFLPLEDYTVWKDTVTAYFRSQWSSEKIKLILGIQDTSVKALCDAFYFLSDHYHVKRFVQDKGDALFFLHGLGDTDSGKISPARASELLAGIGITIKQGDDYSAIKNDIEVKLYEVKKNFEILNNFIEQNADEIRNIRKNLKILKKQDAIDRNTEKLNRLLENYRSLSNAAGLKNVLILLDGCAGLMTGIINDIGEKHYLPALLRDGIFDFDAIVYLVIKLIKEKGKRWLIRRLKEEGFAFDRIYMDEAQDSDIIQNYLVTILSQDDPDNPVTVTVVGDTKQSIYQWRSAYPEEFRAFYNQAKTLTGKKRYDDLKTTWRLTNSGTLDFINGFFEKVSSSAGGLWDYDPIRDALVENPAKTLTKKPNVKIIRLFTNTGLKGYQKFLQDYITGGEVGILGRSRPSTKRSGITNLLAADFKYRTRLETGDENMENIELNDTFYPEYFLVRSLLYTQVAGLNAMLPQLLLFTPSGRLAMNNMKVKDESMFPGIIKSPHAYVTELYRTFYSSKAARTAYNLLDRYKLWEYMWHTTDDGPSADISPQVLSRNINSLLSVIYLHEIKMNSTAFSVEDLLEDLNETATVPYEWYKMPEEKGGTVEVSTVHSAKGLQYDRTIVIDDFDSALNMEPNLGNREFNYFYNISFSNMLDKKPQIKAHFFPYLGGIPAKLIKYLEETDRSLWDGAVEMYEGVNRRIVAEKFNLLYVAMTRSRDGLVIIDMPKSATYREEKMDPDKLAGEIAAYLPAGFVTEPAITGKPEQQKMNQKEIYYMKLSEGKSPFPKMEGAGAMTVRDYVAMESGLVFRSKRKKTPMEISLNIETGIEVHALLERSVKNISNVSALKNEILSRKPEEADSEAAKKAYEILVSKDSAGALSELGPQIASGIFPEVPVWGIKDGVLIKGVMDGLSVTPDRCTVIEYKTVFDGDGDFQESFGKEQVKVYAEFVSEIFKGRKIEGKVVSLGGK